MEAAESAAEKLGNAKGYKVNVTNEEMVKTAIEQIIAERGTVDVLVNNAGLQFISPVEEFPVEKWDLVNRCYFKRNILNDETCTSYDEKTT